MQYEFLQAHEGSQVTFQVKLKCWGVTYIDASMLFLA